MKNKSNIFLNKFYRPDRFLKPVRSVIIITLLLFFSCNNPKEKQEIITKIPVIVEETNISIPDFNSDSAYYFVKKQVDFGPRVPNTKPHKQCSEYLVSKLKSFNFTVTVQEGEVYTFNNSKLNLNNIIAAYKPEATDRILLFAHWDTRPFADQDTKDKNFPIDGASDGASGVAVLLEVARQINLSNPTIGIDIIFFDAEDFGQPDGSMTERQSDTYCLGSQYWARHPHKANYRPRFGILLDMVGGKNATFTKEGTSLNYAPSVARKVWAAAKKIGYSNYFSTKSTDWITDDHLYINKIAKIPSIDIIQYDESTRSNFAAYWHTHNDNMSAIDAATLKAVGQTLLEVIYREK